MPRASITSAVSTAAAGLRSARLRSLSQATGTSSRETIAPMVAMLARRKNRTVKSPPRGIWKRPSGW